MSNSILDSTHNIKFLLSKYYKIKEPYDVKTLSIKNYNSKNYLIITGKTKYVLHEVLDGSSSKKIETMCKILKYCNKNNVCIQLPIKNKDSVYVSNKQIFLTNFYEGTQYTGTKNQILSIAKHLGILHNILSKNKINYNYRLNQNFYHILNSTDFKKISIIKNKKKNLNHFESIFTKEIDSLKSIISVYDKNTKISNFSQNPKQLIHHDLHPGNVIFKNNKVNAIIDFGSMRKGSILEDIAFSSYRFATYEKPFNKIKENISIFLSEYLKHNPVNLISDELTFFLMKKILERISLIIKVYYYSNSDIWTFDFINHMNILKNIYSKNFFNFN
jgi:Ser/Thr protein kinase RdoA (MazF antagonist)